MGNNFLRSLDTSEEEKVVNHLKEEFAESKKSPTPSSKWGVQILRKIKRGHVQHIKYLTLGKPVEFFNTFFNPILRGFDLTPEKLKGGLVTDRLKFPRAKQLIEGYHKLNANLETLDIKIVVLPIITRDCIGFSSNALMSNRKAIISQAGANNLGILIGPLLLQWEKNGLIIPKLMEPMNNVLCVLDMKTKLKFDGEVLMRIAEACCNFNKNYDFSTYIGSGSSIVRSISSHAFVWLLLKQHLQLVEYWKEGGPIHMYFESLLLKESEIKDQQQSKNGNFVNQFDNFFDINFSGVGNIGKFKGFSFTTEDQINFWFKHIHIWSSMAQQEALEYTELLLGFKRAMELKKLYEKSAMDRDSMDTDRDFDFY